jgi:polygalacturonase
MIVLLFFLVAAVFAALDIRDFGAIYGDQSLNTSINNGIAFYNALATANSGADRTVLVPEYTFYMLPYQDISNLSDITIQIDGVLFARTTDIFAWPNHTAAEGSGALNFISISSSTNLMVNGKGSINGNGSIYWEYVITTFNDNRPHLFTGTHIQNLTIQGLTWLNSPQYHILLTDVLDVHIHDVTVYVDSYSQMKLRYGVSSIDELSALIAEKSGNHDDVEDMLGVFPLNTDGIDVSGNNIFLSNVNITNFDDAVAVKPMNQDGILTTCSSNIVIENSLVTYGVGMTIGSVPPNPSFNCVDGVIFRNISFLHPLKAIYVKTNPGDDGYGLINNVSYTDIDVQNALYWTLYLGPQQQTQPGGKGTGCPFNYPLDNTTCVTQPRVPMYEITLRNIFVNGSNYSPGLMRCNETNPGRDWVLDNITIVGSRGYPVGNTTWLCENIGGTFSNISPPLTCSGFQ